MNSKIKAVFFDADGVTIGEERRFGNRLAEDFNIPYEKILPFFKGEFVLCSEGKADLKKEIVKYFSDWKWEKSVDSMLDYWFLGTRTNEEILKFIKQIRENGTNCYLTTDQEKYRAEYILNQLGFNRLFDKCFFSCDIGYRKKDSLFFKKILEEIKILPERILYWDDDLKNLESAQKLGIKTELYSNPSDFYAKMKEYNLL